MPQPNNSHNNKSAKNNSDNTNPGSARSGVPARLPQIDLVALRDFNERFNSAVFGYRAESQKFIAEKNIAPESAEAQGFAYQAFLKGVGHAEMLYRSALLRNPQRELDKIVSAAFLEILTEGNWQRTNYFLKRIGSTAAPSMLKDETLQRAAVYFATDHLMTGKTEHSAHLTEAMQAINSKFWTSEAGVRALRDGAAVICSQDDFRKLTAFIRGYPETGKAFAERLPQVEDAVLRALPTGPRPLVPFLNYFRLREFVTGATFQRTVAARMEHYFQSGDPNSVIELKETLGEYIGIATKQQLKTVAAKFLERERAKLGYFAGEDMAQDTKEAQQAEAKRLAEEAAKLTLIQRYFELPPPGLYLPGSSKAA